jgi:hypothetical protein
MNFQYFCLFAFHFASTVKTDRKSRYSEDCAGIAMFIAG